MCLKIIIESNSKNAVKWCTEDDGGPWKVGFAPNFIRTARRKWPSMEISYRGRASNMTADTLAKQGVHRSLEFTAWL